MKKAGSYNFSSIVCLIACGLYYACGALDSGTTTAAPTPTPMSVDKLPLFTLNCSSLDNLWGTLDWTRSGYDVEHTYIEVVCLRGEKKRKYYGSYLQHEQVHTTTVTPSITPVNIVHISSSTPNMCTAALWDRSVDDHNPGPPSTIEVGPSFTSCDLPITKPYSSSSLSSLPHPTVTDLKTRFDVAPTYPPDHPDSSRAILGAAVSVGIILLLIILGSIIIISIVLVKQRRKHLPGQIVSFCNEIDNRNKQVRILQYPDTDDAHQYEDN